MEFLSYAAASASAWGAISALRGWLADSVHRRTGWISFVAGPTSWRFVPGMAEAEARVLNVALEAIDGGAISPDHFLFEPAAGSEPARITRDGRRDDSLDFAAFRLYLPIVLGAWNAMSRGRPFVTAHLAQSLDGKIACSNGHSQWIGNTANLHHAHRLRALHDAVVVGRRTLEVDDPQLTVRHVPGPSPRRVVLSASGSALRTPCERRAFTGDGATVVVLEGAWAEPAPEGVEVLVARAGAAGYCDPVAITDALRRRGYSSLFVEGGATTISTFLAAGAIDLLHLHIAPIVLGSGVDSFALPEITTIGDGKRFVIATFAMDGEVLLECRAA